MLFLNLFADLSNSGLTVLLKISAFLPVYLHIHIFV